MPLHLQHFDRHESYRCGGLLHNICHHASSSGLLLNNVYHGLKHLVLTVENVKFETHTLLVLDRFPVHASCPTYGELAAYFNHLCATGEPTELNGVLTAKFSEPILHIQLFATDISDNSVERSLLVVDKAGFSYVWQYNKSISQWELVTYFNLINLASCPHRRVLKVDYDAGTQILLWHERYAEQRGRGGKEGEDGHDNDEDNGDNNDSGDDKEDRIRFCHLTVEDKLSDSDGVNDDKHSTTANLGSSQASANSSSISHAVTIKSLPAIKTFHQVHNGCWIVCGPSDAAAQQSLVVYYYDFCACQMLSMNVDREVFSEEGGQRVNCANGDGDAFITTVCQHSKTDVYQDTLYIMNLTTGRVTVVKRSKHRLSVFSSHNLLPKLCVALRGTDSGCAGATVSNTRLVSDIHIAREDTQGAFIWLLSTDQQRCFLFRYAHGPLDGLSQSDLLLGGGDGGGGGGISASSSGSYRRKSSNRAIKKYLERLVENEQFVELKVPQPAQGRDRDIAGNALHFAPCRLIIRSQDGTMEADCASSNHVVPIFATNSISSDNTQQQSTWRTSHPRGGRGTEKNNSITAPSRILLLLWCGDSAVLQITAPVKESPESTVDVNSSQVHNGLYKTVFCTVHVNHIFLLLLLQFWASLIRDSQPVEEGSLETGQTELVRRYSADLPTEIEEEDADDESPAGDAQQRWARSDSMEAQPSELLQPPQPPTKKKQQPSVFDVPMDQLFRQVLSPPNLPVKPLLQVSTTVFSSTVDDSLTTASTAASSTKYGPPFKLITPKTSRLSGAHSVSGSSREVTPRVDSARQSNSNSSNSSNNNKAPFFGQHMPVPSPSPSAVSSTYLLDLLRTEEGLDDSAPTTDDTPSLPPTATGSGSAPSAAPHDPSVVGTAGACAGAGVSSMVLLTTENADDFVRQCMSEFMRLRPRPSSIPKATTNGVSGVADDEVPVSLGLSIFTDIGTLNSNNSHEDGEEPLCALDIERDAELEYILREHNRRRGGVICASTADIARDNSQSATAEEDIRMVERRVESLSPHWMDYVDLVTLSPPLDLSFYNTTLDERGRGELLLASSRHNSGGGACSGMGEDFVSNATEGSDVLTRVYALIGPFRLLELVKSLHPHPDTNINREVDSQSQYRANGTLSSEGYTVELLMRRMLFTDPADLFPVIVYLVGVEADLQRRHEAALLNKRAADLNKHKQRLSEGFQAPQPPAIVTQVADNLMSTEFGATVHVYDESDDDDSDDDDDDELWGAIFRDVGGDEEGEEEQNKDSGIGRTTAACDTGSGRKSVVNAAVGTELQLNNSNSADHNHNVSRNDDNDDDDHDDDDDEDNGGSDEFSLFQTVSSEDEDDDQDDHKEDTSSSDRDSSQVDEIETRLAVDAEVPLNPFGGEDGVGQLTEVSDDDDDNDDEDDDDDDDNNNIILLADLAPLSRRVSDNNLRFSGGVGQVPEISPSDLYRQHSMRESRLSGFSEMPEIGSPQQTAAKSLTDTPVTGGSEGVASMEEVALKTAPSVELGLKTAVSVVSNENSTLRDKVRLFAAAIVSYSIQQQLQQQESELTVSGSSSSAAEHDGPHSQQQQHMSHFADLSTPQQDCLVQMLLLSGDPLLAGHALAAWDRHDLFALLAVRVAASAAYVSGYYSSEGLDSDDISCGFVSTRGNDRSQGATFKQEYFVTGRGRFSAPQCFESRPPLPRAVLSAAGMDGVSASAIPVWDGAFGNSWGPHTTITEQAAKTSREGEVEAKQGKLSFAEKRTADSKELMNTAHKFC